MLGLVASMRGTFSAGSVATDADSSVDDLCSVSSIFSISRVRAALACLVVTASVKYLSLYRGSSKVATE